jgi:hypothetical protein
LLNIIPINAILPPSFPHLEALLEGCLWYHLHISDDGIHSLKYSSIMANIKFREHKKVGRISQVNRGVVKG